MPKEYMKLFSKDPMPSETDPSEYTDVVYCINSYTDILAFPEYAAKRRTASISDATLLRYILGGVIRAHDAIEDTLGIVIHLTFRTVYTDEYLRRIHAGKYDMRPLHKFISDAGFQLEGDITVESNLALTIHCKILERPLSTYTLKTQPDAVLYETIRSTWLKGVITTTTQCGCVKYVTIRTQETDEYLRRNMVAPGNKYNMEPLRQYIGPDIDYTIIVEKNRALTFCYNRITN